MVLEHIFPDSWLEKKFALSFFLGAGFSVIGILLARLLFGSNSGLASVIFTSLLIIPSLYKLFKSEEKLEEKERKFSLKKLYEDNKGLIHAYLGVFLGVFFAYYIIAFMSAQFGWNTISIFREQLFLDPAIMGRAAYSFPTFWSILANNWWVLLACFFLSLLTGNGATFFVAWNASAWGAIFGMRAVAAATILGKSSLGVGGIMTLITLPHILLEGGAYILAGIAGAVISRDIVSESKEMGKFLGILIAIIIGFFVLNMFFKIIMGGPLLVVLRMLLVLGLVYTLKNAFLDKKHKEVFTYNFWLFAIAMGVFILGALVETGVLSWSGTLNLYYAASAMFFA